MRYLPHTEEEIQAMLKVIGVDSVDALFEAVPARFRLDRELDMEPALDETALLAHMQELADVNRDPARTRAFLGAGLYRHYAPTAIDQLLLRAEFYTAYTPYQPEVSQGTLQAMFEYQTMVGRLLDMEVSNASLYDGSTAFTEAILMARRIARKRSRIVVAGAIHPEYMEVLRTYLLDPENLVCVPPGTDGRVDRDAVAEALGDEPAALAVQSPNFYGIIEDLAPLAELAHGKGALLITAFSEATAFGLLQPPGSQGADIVIGEGQALGLPINLGGPLLGILGTRKKFVRAVPGRLVGQTVDRRGETGYVVTLSTREQHIRRERATSNICTNEGLCALAAAMYLTLMGPTGLRAVALRSHNQAARLRDALVALPGVEQAWPDAPFYNEFVLKTPQPAADLLKKLADRDIAGGVALSAFDPEDTDRMLVTATELTTDEDIAAYAAALQSIIL